MGDSAEGTSTDVELENKAATQRQAEHTFLAEGPDQKLLHHLSDRSKPDQPK